MVPVIPVLTRFVLPTILTAAAGMVVAMVVMVSTDDNKKDLQKKYDKSRDENKP